MLRTVIANEEPCEQDVAGGRSPVNVCFTSRSSAGAWQIRGLQIAATRSNWVALNKPTDDDLERADVVCLVKRPDPRVIERARRMGKALVFDIVDSWSQPDDGLKYTDVAKAREFFASAWKGIDADGYVFPTRRMEACLGGLVRDRVTIYHHYRTQIEQNPVRERVAVVGYEGGDYLGEWHARIDRACTERGIRFVVNPQRYSDLDVVIMARGGEHGSFLARHFKSNVKLANAIGSGTPALAHYDEMSAHDTDPGDVLFFTDQPGSFERQLDRLVASRALRQEIHRGFLAAAPNFHIANISNQFEAFFVHVLERQRVRRAAGC
ncbi:MAG: hypothetical protein KDH20_03335 [Rhodocyclaceae bacterium]|nr:hypothetical protein [Rhodocyclaceae bacterium]